MQKCQSILPLVQSDPHISSKIPRFTESNMWNALFPRYSAPKGSLTFKQISLKCLAQVKYLKWFFGPLCKRSKKEPGGLLYLLSFSSLLLGECVYQDVFHCAWLLRSQRPKSTVLTQIMNGVDFNNSLRSGKFITAAVVQLVWWSLRDWRLGVFCDF